MNMFKENKLYRHDKFMDIDMLVLTNHENRFLSYLKVKFVHRRFGPYEDKFDREVIVWKDKYNEWREVVYNECRNG